LVLLQRLAQPHLVLSHLLIDVIQLGRGDLGRAAVVFTRQQLELELVLHLVRVELLNQAQPQQLQA